MTSRVVTAPLAVRRTASVLAFAAFVLAACPVVAAEAPPAGGPLADTVALYDLWAAE